MSYSQTPSVHPLGNHQTNREILTQEINTIWDSRMSRVTDIQKILDAQTGEEWSTRIIDALIQNLSFDGSIYGHFGTPDKDIKNIVYNSGNSKNLWVKLLGIKMNILLSLLDTLPGISSTQKQRIQDIDNHFQSIFPEKKHS